MRRADDHIDSLVREPLENRNRDVEAWRSVIDTREQVRVDVDHARAASASSRTAGAPCRSSNVPTTTKSAPASRAARTASADRTPPPTNSGPRVAARAARMRAGDTGRRAPLPASRYVAAIPTSMAARTCAVTSSGLLAGKGRVWLTASTE